MELIVISRDGIVIRTRMDSIRMTGRSAQGVTVISVAQDDQVAALATIEMGAIGPKGPGDDAEQSALDLDDSEVEASADDTAPARKGVKKPTPIRGRGKPARAAAPAPAKSPAARKPAARKPAPKSPPRKPKR